MIKDLNFEVFSLLNLLIVLLVCLQLFFKPEAYKKDIKIDYIGIRIPNKFIVGYGLDYDGLGRNLTQVYKLAE